MSSIAPRWIKRALVLLAIAQAATLAAWSAPFSIAGISAGDSKAASTEEPGASEDPAPPASGTTTTVEGDSPPDITPTIIGTLGENGWYTTDVELSWNAADAETPDVTTEGCEPATITEDTTGATHSCRASSEGGSRTTIVTIARDTAAPSSVTVTTDIEPATTGWFTQPFIASWQGEDATSGIATCTATNYSGPETADGALNGTCTDKAGNESDAVPFAFKYDASAPEVIGTPDRDPDHNGWFNRALTITWASTDPDAVCDAPTSYSGPDDADASVTGGCTDPAGNRGTATFSFKFDATAPSVSLRTPADGAIYILRQPVEVDYSCSDGIAVASCSGPVADGAALDTSAVGARTFTVTATDEAGNQSSATSSYAIQYQPAGVLCGGVPGHTILEPIGHRSTFKQGSTVPAKFRVCDFFGVPVTSAGVVDSFRIVEVDGAATDRAVRSTSAHQDFRAGDAQWIFNIDTKPLAKAAHGFRIALNDGTSIDFGFLLR